MDVERRQHWDDDLLHALDVALGPHDLTRDQRYDVLAAVEDWMDANDNPLHHVLNECLQWLDAERAAIARVRELHHPIPGFNGSQWCDAHCEATTDGDPTYWPCETIRALDGGAK